MSAPQSSSNGTDPAMLPCPLCHAKGDTIMRGFCFITGQHGRGQAVRCPTCGCRATLEAWQARHTAPQAQAGGAAQTARETCVDCGHRDPCDDDCPNFIDPSPPSALPAGEAEGIQWRRVNDEPFEYAIQKGFFGDEFVHLVSGGCLRRSLPIPSTDREGT